MIPLKTISDIRRLLREGELSRRKIALRVGVSRGTVNAIAAGRQLDYRRIQREHAAKKAALTVKPPGRKKGRCETCRATVYLPCVACQVLAIKAREQ